LALLVWLLFATGMMSLFAGRSGDAWVFAVHGAGGFALGGALVWIAVGGFATRTPPRARTLVNSRKLRAFSARWSARHAPNIPAKRPHLGAERLGSHPGGRRFESR
jgi:hypothetical protein